jgi:adenosylcobinamide-phosphate synthase
MSIAPIALALEALLGYPDALYRRVGHPVNVFAALIHALERRLNDPRAAFERRRALGVGAAALTLAAGAGWGLALQAIARRTRRPKLVSALFATPGLAQSSLFKHVEAVRRPLRAGDLAAARVELGKIVGRDTGDLDEVAIAAATLESLAESFNDGVAAPAFWLALAGLPGLYAYKALNTADSLVGHKEPRWRAYGWASARADDVANLAPARLAGGLIALAGGGGWRTLARDGAKHDSPNAGWPQAALAGALGVRLGGPVRYDGVRVDRPILGPEGRAPCAGDLTRALRVYRLACALLAGGLLGASLLRRRR